MVAHNDRVWVRADRAFNKNFNTHDPLHPKAIDPHGRSVETMREGDDDLRLKPWHGYEFERCDEQQGAQPNQQIAGKPNARQDA